jgi:hypothetical protein
MQWDEFLAEHRDDVWMVILDENHVIRLTTADVENYHDNGLRKDGKFVQGGIMNHRRPDGGTCGGYVDFARLLNPSEREKDRPLWTVSSLEPLTMMPSLLCKAQKFDDNGPIPDSECGEHGWIRDGTWVVA